MFAQRSSPGEKATMAALQRHRISTLINVAPKSLVRSVKAICRFSGCSVRRVFVCEEFAARLCAPRQELKHNQEDANGWERYDPPQHLGKTFSFRLVYRDLANRYDAESSIIPVHTRTTCWERSLSYFLRGKSSVLGRKGFENPHKKLKAQYVPCPATRWQRA